MKIKVTISLILLGIITIGAGCIVPGQSVGGPIQTLHDHITEIKGETLPKAILEARERGMKTVTVTDKNNNVISINIESPTFTEFTITDPIVVYDVVLFMQKYNIDLSNAYDISRERGEYNFKINTVRHDELATIIYEMSVRIFKVGTTQDWTIDLAS